MHNKRSQKGNNLSFLIFALGIILAGLIVLVFFLEQDKSSSANPSETQASVTQEQTDLPTDSPTNAPIVKQSTATIGNTGDIMFHKRVIQCGYDASTDSFNYDHIYKHWKTYIQQLDYATANLELTLIQNESEGDFKGYNGYPQFNAPDAVVEALKDAGFDMLLTANNHSYDRRNKGLIRTQQVLDSLGIDRIGTRLTEDAPNYLVKEINGITFGMINYTYTTSMDEDGKIALNGIPVGKDSPLVNAFSYARLDSFYHKLEDEIADMKADGAEVILLYIHWGDEYQTTENKTQNKMAQALCNLGIDVIVGDHPHVPQPVELLTNENDQTKKTLCLYSTGNAVSNISRADKRPKNTEDGMLFSVTFAKYSDGTVVLESADIMPTWVDRIDESDGSDQFVVLPLDDTVPDWKSAMNLSDATLKECKDSYKRTMGIVGEGLEQANAYYAQNQQEVESRLGVKN